MGNDLERIVITGVGIVSALGAGKEDFWRALEVGVSGVKAISIFNTSDLGCKKAGEISDFKPENYFSKKGLGYLSRTAALGCSAALLCVADLQLGPGAIAPTEIGIVLGTNFGNTQSMMLFEQEIVTDGPRFVNPMLFPNTVINSVVGYISILLGYKGMNSTISTGSSAAGLDAIQYAIESLSRDDEVKIILCGGSEELSFFTYSQLMQAKRLAGSKDAALETSAPMDKNRSGFIVGEAASFLALERLDQARARQATILAEVAGYGNSFNPYDEAHEERQIESQATAMRAALDCAGLKPQAISYVLSSANGSVRGDRIEVASIKRVFSNGSTRVVPVTSIKSMIGECLGAAGALQCAAAVSSLQYNVIPPTANFTELDAMLAPLDVCAQKRACACQAIMVNSFDICGVSNSSIIIKRFSQ